MASSISFLVLFLVGLAACADLHVHDESFYPDQILRLSFANVSAACFERPTVLVNGTTPGPAVRVKADQVTWIRVYNDMTDQNATVHWHGLSQSVAPFSDGTPLASQWPIPPLHYFDYELKPHANESGSYFYHSHVEFQTVSATGPLIVEEPEGQSPPYQYDDERIFFLTEFYKRTDQSIVDGLRQAPFLWSGEPDAILVNGHQQAVVNATTDQCAPEVIEVEPDTSYRFRFIGGVALADIIFAIDQHSNITIIEADGSYTNPSEVSHMQVDSGQRFDAIIQTKSAAELQSCNQTDFWIQLEDRYRPTVVTGYALLRYKNQTEKVQYYPGTARQTLPSVPANPPNLTSLLPAEGDNTTNTWLEYTLTPLKPNNFPSASEVTRTLYLYSIQLGAAGGAILFDVDNHTWTAEPTNGSYFSSPNQRPYLVDIYQKGDSAIPSGASAAAYYQAQIEAAAQDPAAHNSTLNPVLPSGYDPNFNAFGANVSEVIDIVLLNEAGLAGSFDVHPWHAHGGHYYDLGSGPGMYDANSNNAYLEQLYNKSGYVPALRDSTMLYRWPANNMVNDTEGTVSGWRAWRLRVDDPGVWMIHCHTLQHMIMGMQTVWVMGDAAQITGGDGNTFEEDQGYYSYGNNVTGEYNATSSGSYAEKRSRGSMDGYLSFGGSAYGNADRAPVVNHHFR